MAIPLLDHMLGINVKHLTISHLIIRSLFVYILGIILGRINRRFIAIRTTTNFFLFIFIGSILATAIVGELFYEILAMAIFIMLVNWLVVILGYYVSDFRIFLEGKPLVLIENGKINKKELNKCFISEEKLKALLRVKTHLSDISEVQKAYFENSGEISFILKKSLEKKDSSLVN